MEEVQCQEATDVGVTGRCLISLGTVFPKLWCCSQPYKLPVPRVTCDHLLSIHLAFCIPKCKFCFGLFHTTWFELSLQTCYLRQAWTAREISLTWAGVLCRGLIQLPMKETNVSCLLHHPTLASSAWWKDDCSNCMQPIKTLDHSIEGEEKASCGSRKLPEALLS